MSKLLRSKVQPIANANRQHKPLRRSVKKTFGCIVNVLLNAPEEFYLSSTKQHVTHTYKPC